MKVDQSTTESRLRAWAKVLRSGDYKQTQELLGEDDGVGWEYCCLGVACIVALGQDQADKEIDWDSGDAPTSVIEWFGVDINAINIQPREYEEHEYEGVRDVLVPSGANDDGGWTFDEIADAIDKMIKEERY